MERQPGIEFKQPTILIVNDDPFVKRSVFISIVLLWAALCFHPFSAYAEELVWYKFDVAPAFINSGPYRDQGFFDLSYNLFREEMKGYSHVIKLSNVKRLVNDVQTQHAIAEAMLKNSDREKVMEFSVAHAITIPHVIIIEKSRAKELRPYMTAGGSVMLEKLITKSNLKLNIASGRSYSSFIDEILKKYSNHRNIAIRSATEGITEGSMKMMLAKRTDYTIAYPFEIQYHAKLTNMADKFIGFPIDGIPKYYLVYAAVGKNEWGRKILSELNPVILKHRNTRKSRKYVEAWLDDNMKALYRKYMDEAFGPATN